MAAAIAFTAEKYALDIEKTIPLDIIDATLNLLSARRSDLQGQREPGWPADAWWASACAKRRLPIRTNYMSLFTVDDTN